MLVLGSQAKLIFAHSGLFFVSVYKAIKTFTHNIMQQLNISIVRYCPPFYMAILLIKYQTMSIH